MGSWECYLKYIELSCFSYFPSVKWTNRDLLTTVALKYCHRAIIVRRLLLVLSMMRKLATLTGPVDHLRTEGICSSHPQPLLVRVKTVLSCDFNGSSAEIPDTPVCVFVMRHILSTKGPFRFTVGKLPMALHCLAYERTNQQQCVLLNLILTLYFKYMFFCSIISLRACHSCQTSQTKYNLDSRILPCCQHWIKFSYKTVLPTLAPGLFLA